MPAETQPLMPSIFNFIDLFLLPMQGSIRETRVYSLSGKLGMVTFLGSTSLRLELRREGEYLKDLTDD